jgi:hypothetical protein
VSVLAVRELTSRRGVEQVVDVGGGTLPHSIRSVALEGQINFIGRLSNNASSIDMNMLFTGSGQPSTARSLSIGPWMHFATTNRQPLSARSSSGTGPLDGTLQRASAFTLIAVVA